MRSGPAWTRRAAAALVALAPAVAVGAVPRAPLDLGSLPDDTNTDDSLLFAYTSRGDSSAPTLETYGIWVQTRSAEGVLVSLGFFPAHQNTSTTAAVFGFGGHFGLGYGRRLFALAVTEAPALSVALGVHLQAVVDYLRLAGQTSDDGRVSATGLGGLVVELFGRPFKEVDLRTAFSVDFVGPNFALTNVAAGSSRKLDDYLLQLGVHATFNWSATNPTPVLLSVTVARDLVNDVFADRAVAVGISF